MAKRTAKSKTSTISGQDSALTTATIAQSEQADAVLSTTITEISQPAPAKISKLQRRTQVINRSKLTGAPYNPRSIDPIARRKLRKSIEKFGLVEPPVWNKRSGNVVGGHQRLDRLDEIEGRADYDLEVVVIDVDDKTEKELNVALNNPGLQGDYDINKLHAMISDTPGIDIHNMGFEVPDLQLVYLDHGLPTELLDRFYSPEALANIKKVTQAANALMDEADAIRQEEKIRNPKPSASGDPTEDGDDDDTVDDGLELSADEQAEADKIAGIKARRNAYANRVELENQAGFFVTIVFETDERKQAFMTGLDLDPLAVEVDGPNLAEALDIPLPPCPVEEPKQKKTKLETVPY